MNYVLWLHLNSVLAFHAGACLYFLYQVKLLVILPSVDENA